MITYNNSTHHLKDFELDDERERVFIHFYDRGSLDRPYDSAMFLIKMMDLSTEKQPKISDLKRDALDFFDRWKDSLITRIDDAVKISNIHGENSTLNKQMPIMDQPLFETKVIRRFFIYRQTFLPLNSLTI